MKLKRDIPAAIRELQRERPHKELQKEEEDQRCQGLYLLGT